MAETMPSVQDIPQESKLPSGFEKTRVFLKKPNPVGFWGFYWVFLDKQEKNR